MPPPTLRLRVGNQVVPLLSFAEEVSLQMDVPEACRAHGDGHHPAPPIPAGLEGGDGVIHVRGPGVVVLRAVVGHLPRHVAGGPDPSIHGVHQGALLPGDEPFLPVETKGVGGPIPLAQDHTRDLPLPLVVEEMVPKERVEQIGLRQGRLAKADGQEVVVRRQVPGLSVGILRCRVRQDLEKPPPIGGRNGGAARRANAPGELPPLGAPVTGLE